VGFGGEAVGLPLEFRAWFGGAAFAFEDFEEVELGQGWGFGEG